MDWLFFLGFFFGFFGGFFLLKRTINKTGYGELKMCKKSCPYYKSSVINTGDDSNE